jgi:hypothetical protein
MLYPRTRPAAAVSAALLAFVLLSACGADGGAAEKAAAGAVTAQSASESAPSVVVQMSGLLLLVPSAENGMQVLMPRLAGHDAFIGYKKASSTGCWRYDAARKICYQNMDGWMLDPIGRKGANAPSTSVLNLTRGSGGKKINVRQAKAEMRSSLTLGSGVETEQCNLAEWTFHPVGNEGSSRVKLINVMKWRIEDSGANRIVLKRTRLDSTVVSQELATISQTNGEIQLLVMHIPNAETKEFFRVTSVPHSAPAGSANGLPTGSHQSRETEDLAMIEEHFHAFYNLMKVEQGKRPMPTDMRKRRAICPITILDLRDVFPTQSDTTVWGPKGRPQAGISTFSCVMTSAEPED